MRYTGMAAWEKLLSDDDIWTIVTFLSHSQELRPEVSAEW